MASSQTVETPRSSSVRRVNAVLSPDGTLARIHGGLRMSPTPGDEVQLAFRSAASFVPAETGRGPDTRRLAVQLLDLETLHP